MKNSKVWFFVGGLLGLSSLVPYFLDKPFIHRFVGAGATIILMIGLYLLRREGRQNNRLKLMVYGKPGQGITARNYEELQTAIKKRDETK